MRDRAQAGEYGKLDHLQLLGLPLGPHRLAHLLSDDLRRDLPHPRQERLRLRRDPLRHGHRIVKRPKLYFRDTGLLCWLLGVGAPLPPSGPWNGALWETLAFAEMRKAISASGKNRTVYYYRGNADLEVDFVAAGEGLRLVETKWTGLPKPADAGGLRKLAAIGLGRGAPEFAEVRGYLLCATDRDFPIALPEGALAKGGAGGKNPPIPVAAVGLSSVGRMLGL